MAGILDVTRDRYDSSASLVRLLCLAVDKLGGELEVPEGFELDSKPEYEVTWMYEAEGFGRKLKVYRLTGVNDVLDVTTLEEAHSYEVRDQDDNVIAKVWEARANGVMATLRTQDTSAVYYASPILTMRTKGVSLVDSSGQMATHSVVSR